MTERRKAPIEVLERLAEAQAKIYSTLPDGDEMLPPDVAAYRAATAPLRTRQEVDAEIASATRAWARSESATVRDAMVRLCSEPTADEPEADPGRECDWCQDSSRPKLYRNRIPEQIVWVCRQCLENHGKAPKTEPLEDPEPCGCDQAEHLKRKLADIRTEYELWETSAKGSTPTLSAIALILRGG